MTKHSAIAVGTSGMSLQLFAYQAKDKTGQSVSGEMEASTLAEARSRLRSQGLFVTSITSASNKRAGRRFQLSFQGRIKKREILMQFSQLTIMCQSGVDLAEALQSLATQCRKPALKAVMQRVSTDVTNGSTFSDALRKHPMVFDRTFVAAVASGEKASSITPVLERLTQLMRSDLRFRSTIWSMLAYPLVLCAVTVLVVIALLFFVLPQFSKVFTDLEKPVPPLTAVLLSFGDFVRGHLIIVLGSMMGLGVAGYTMRNAEMLRRLCDRLTLHGPVIKNATRAICTGRTYRLLGTMLASGVSLVDGIRLCAASTKNSLFRELFEQIEQDVLRGEGLGRALLSSSILPPNAAQMIATAERTGRLDAVLKTVGEYFEDEGEQYLRSCIKLLEPAVIVFLGLVVAAVVLSVILPLLDVSTASHY